MPKIIKTIYNSCVIALGSMTQGIITVYYSPTRPGLVKEFNLTDTEANLFNSFALIFALLGSLISKPLVRVAGRRLSVTIVAIIVTISFGLLIFSKSKIFLFIPRCILGIMLGIIATLNSMYLVEIAPEKYRATFGVFHQLFLNIGQLLDYLLGIFFEWKLLTVIVLLVPALEVLLLPSVPDSNVVEKKETSESIFQKRFLKPFIHSLFLIFFQQFSGINAVLTNLDGIFQDANTNLRAGVPSVLVAIGSIIATLGCSAAIKKLGRKPCFYLSCFGDTIFLLLFWLNELMNISKYLPVVALFLYNVAFGFGLGPVVYLVMPELFPDTVRSTFMAVIITICWMMGGGVTFCLPFLEKLLTLGWSCFIFACCCFAGGIYAVFFMPDTATAKVAENEDQVNEITTIQDDTNKSTLNTNLV